MSVDATERGFPFQDGSDRAEVLNALFQEVKEQSPVGRLFVAARDSMLAEKPAPATRMFYAASECAVMTYLSQPGYARQKCSTARSQGLRALHKMVGEDPSITTTEYDKIRSDIERAFEDQYGMLLERLLKADAAIDYPTSAD